MKNETSRNSNSPSSPATGQPGEKERHQFRRVAQRQVCMKCRLTSQIIPPVDGLPRREWWYETVPYHRIITSLDRTPTGCGQPLKSAASYPDPNKPKPRKRQPTRKITITIPHSLWEAAVANALARNSTLRTYVTETLRLATRAR